MSLLQNIGWESHLKPFLYKKLPAQTGWSAVLGTLCALNFIILMLTGMVLAFYYVPSPDKAWYSVQFISNDLPLGQILRGLHHWGAGSMVLLVFCHLMVTYLNGSYKAPRQITWVTGALLFLTTLGLGFTGYLLPWDMKAYWATVVGANIPSNYPLAGEYITRFILGGEGMSGFTLTRFYSVHTLVLPACLLFFMAMHIYLIRLHNLSDPRERLANEKLPPETGKPYRFYPEHLNRVALVFGALFIVLLYVSATMPAPVEEKAGTFIADYLPRPEWYYMWLFQLLTYFSGTWEIIGSLILPVGGIILLFAIPFIGESQLKGIGNRPVALTVGCTFIICVVYLTIMAYADAAPYNKTVIIPSRELSAQEQKGLQLYVERECAYCHNIMGQGGHRTGPDLSNTARKKRSPEYLTAYINKPQSQFSTSTMPDYDLPKEDLQSLAAFLLSLDFKNGVQPLEIPTEQIRKKAEQSQ